MNRSSKPSVPRARRSRRAPHEGVIRGLPSAEVLRREAEVTARRAVPYLILEGAWLKRCGFEIGRAYKVRAEKDSIVLVAT